MTQLVVIIIKVNGLAHLGSGNTGVNEALGHCSGSQDDVSKSTMSNVVFRSVTCRKLLLGRLGADFVDFVIFVKGRGPESFF